MIMAETYYMEVTKDKYELPVAVAETTGELARIRGVAHNTIKSVMYHAKRKKSECKYIKVVIDEEEGKVNEP